MFSVQLTGRDNPMGRKSKDKIKTAKERLVCRWCNRDSDPKVCASCQELSAIIDRDPAIVRRMLATALKAHASPNADILLLSVEYQAQHLPTPARQRVAFLMRLLAEHIESDGLATQARYRLADWNTAIVLRLTDTGAP